MVRGPEIWRTSTSPNSAEGWTASRIDTPRGRCSNSYDERLRAAASLKRGWVPASSLLHPPEEHSPLTPLAGALGGTAGSSARGSGSNGAEMGVKR